MTDEQRAETHARIERNLDSLEKHSEILFAELEALRAENARLRAALAAAPRWVPVTERLPEDEERDGYIAARIEMATFVEATYDGSQWLEWDRHLDDWKPLAGVTHWHALPGL